MKFRPLQDRILIRLIYEEEKTAGGIIIPDTAKEKPMEGEVIAAGPGTRGDDGKLQPLDIKVGDRVLFGKWSGTEIKIDCASDASCTNVLSDMHPIRDRVAVSRPLTSPIPESGEAENITPGSAATMTRNPALNRSYAVQLNRLSDTAMEE